MDERSRLAREILIAALLLGAAADGLLRVGPWSLNLTLWITVVLAVTVGMATRHRVDWPRDTIWLVAPVVLFAMAISWRGTPVLMLLDLGAIAVCITVWGMRLESVQIPNQGILDYARGALNLGVSTAAGAAPLADKKISVVPEARSVKWKHARAATLGVAISLPLLFVFGGLLMAADAVFDQMVSATFDIDLGRLASHGVLTGIFAWIVCGFLLLILRFSKPHLKEAFTIERPSLGIVEVAVPLALVNLLFLAFVVVQLRYLFGDASLVQETVGLTYSEYARRGFFELVAVAALVLPLLLIGDWLLTGADSRSLRVFRGLAGTMLLLLFVIVASALKRMNLYQTAYGLTDARLYTTAFMTWLGITLVWFGATVLSGRRHYFATGGLIAGLCMVAALNVVNPDALIARVNTTRALEGKEFDAPYALSLSADAVPALLGALESLDPDDRGVIARRLLDRWSREAGEDWRTWNASRAQARQAVADRRSELEQAVVFAPLKWPS
jgi:hypothetical protein